MDHLPISVQIALTRARMVARSNVARAVDILRAIGATLAQAVRYVAQFVSRGPVPVNS